MLQAIETAKDLLDGITTEQFSALGVAALRRWRKTVEHYPLRGQ
jgi:hypothetical protein